jgi:hypothetical protein
VSVSERVEVDLRRLIRVPARVSGAILACFVLFGAPAGAPVPGWPGPAPAAAQPVDRGGFTIGRLKYGGGGDWYNGPTMIPNLLRGLKERTTVPVLNLKEEVVEAGDEKLFAIPFLYMTGHGNVKFGEDEIRNLRKYLTSGGFLFANDDYGMDKAFRREIRRIFPDAPLVEVPFSHPIYHCFYDFPAGLPKIHEHDKLPPQGFGVFREGRLVVFYDYQSDIGNGLEDPGTYNDPPEKHEAALRMAINIVVYAMTQ